MEWMTTRASAMSLFNAMGGMVPFADDGMNALSPTRRNAAFLIPVRNQEVRDAIFAISYAGLDPSTDDFPGSSCHNHALTFEMGPQKTNWTKSCPLDWPQEEREEKCLSQNEASWGSVILARLEALKEEVDPDNLFICASGVGYSNPVSEMQNGTPSAAPSTSESPSSSTPTEAPAPSPPPSGSGSNVVEGLVVPTILASLCSILLLFLH